MNKASAFVAVQMVLFALLLGVFIAFPPQDLGIGRWIGFLCMGISVTVLLLAIQAHGTVNQGAPNITPTPKATAELVTVGVYQRVRHPIYTAVLFGTFGAGLAHGHWLGVGMWLIFVGFFTLKSRYEETLLRAVYSDYHAYQARTGRFFPPLR